MRSCCLITRAGQRKDRGAFAAWPAAKAPQVNGAFHPTNDAILVPKTSFETRSTVRSLRESMWTGALVRHSSIPVLFGRNGSTYPAGGRGSVGNDSTVVVGGGGWPPASASSSRVGRVFPGRLGSRSRGCARRSSCMRWIRMPSRPVRVKRYTPRARHTHSTPTPTRRTAIPIIVSTSTPNCLDRRRPILLDVCVNVAVLTSNAS
jgi:hypothetical protein